MNRKKIQVMIGKLIQNLCISTYEVRLFWKKKKEGGFFNKEYFDIFAYHINFINYTDYETNYTHFPDFGNYW